MGVGRGLDSRLHCLLSFGLIREQEHELWEMRGRGLVTSRDRLEQPTVSSGSGQAAGQQFEPVSGTDAGARPMQPMCMLTGIFAL